MKKLLILAMLTACALGAAGFSAGGAAGFSAAASANSRVGGSLKIVNDTDGDVQIHTGAGFVELNKGASTSVTCEAGREIRSADKGKKGGVIFTIDESMCGKTVKLSKYL